MARRSLVAAAAARSERPAPLPPELLAPSRLLAPTRASALRLPLTRGPPQSPPLPPAHARPSPLRPRSPGRAPGQGPQLPLVAAVAPPRGGAPASTARSRGAAPRDGDSRRLAPPPSKRPRPAGARDSALRLGGPSCPRP